jgi:Papain-like cysteine protease AvrRpt2
MLTRRAVLTGVLTLAIARPGPVAARTSCRRVEDTPQICRAEVDFQDFLQHAYDPQRASQWCWAACISMIFAFHGHPVRQERIVEEAYGGLYDWPSGSGRNIARQLDRRWVDDHGRPSGRDCFRSSMPMTAPTGWTTDLSSMGFPRSGRSSSARGTTPWC